MHKIPGINNIFLIVVIHVLEMNIHPVGIRGFQIDFLIGWIVSR